MGEPVSDFIRLLLKVMEGREKLRAWGHWGFLKVRNTQGIRHKMAKFLYQRLQRIKISNFITVLIILTDLF